MKIQEYQAWTHTTAIYPRRDHIEGVMYCALKLTGEIVELRNSTGRDDWVKELGDIAYYIAELANQLGLDLSGVDLSWVKGIPSLSMSFRDGLHEGLMERSAAFGETVGKAYRDGGFKDYDATLMALGRMYANWVNLTPGTRLSVSDVLDANVAKLESRKERGVIGGSGDSR